MTALYGYKDKETQQRVVALALRNKDAALLGMSGPECGDIIYFLAEGYNFDHGDSDVYKRQSLRCRIWRQRGYSAISPKQTKRTNGMPRSSLKHFSNLFIR